MSIVIKDADPQGLDAFAPLLEASVDARARTSIEGIGAKAWLARCFGTSSGK